ncbi:MAG: helix-turn-helix domain-containing protein [archaeon]
MDLSVLEGIGLSKNETTIFVKLIELGESKAGTAISSSGLQSSAVYNAINSLIDKGLVSFTKKNGIKYYKSAEPETILEYMDKKKGEYLKLLPELQLKKRKDEPEGVEYFRSSRGIKSLVFELLRDAKKGEIYRFIAADPKYYKIATEQVYSAEKQLRKEKHIRTKALFHISAKSQTKRSSTSVKRYLDAAMPPNTLIFNGKVAIISWEGEHSGILIRSKDIYQTYVSFFEDLWKSAKS